MNVTISTKFEPMKTNDANGYTTNAVQVEDTLIKLNTNEIKMHQEHNLTGPIATQIKIEDKETGKICVFEVRAIMKNGRPALETYPVGGGDIKKLTFGKLREATPQRTVRAAKRSSDTMLATGLLSAGLFSK